MCLSIAQMTRLWLDEPLEPVQRMKRVIRILYFYIRIYTLRFIRCIVIYMTVEKSKDLSQGSIVFFFVNGNFICIYDATKEVALFFSTLYNFSVI